MEPDGITRIYISVSDKSRTREIWPLKQTVNTTGSLAQEVINRADIIGTYTSRVISTNSLKIFTRIDGKQPDINFTFELSGVWSERYRFLAEELEERLNTTGLTIIIIDH
jgi:hypothetical protein